MLGCISLHYCAHCSSRAKVSTRALGYLSWHHHAPWLHPCAPCWLLGQPCFAKAWAPSICQAQGDPYQLRPGRKALSSATAHTLHLCC